MVGIAKRKTQNELVSASSISVSGKVYLFNYETTGTPSMEIISEEGEAIFDPQAEIRSNKIVLIKEVIGGENHTYFIPCSSDNNDCRSARDFAMNELQAKFPEIYDTGGTSPRTEADDGDRTETGGFKC